jgi:bacillopeptidase F
MLRKKQRQVRAFSILAAIIMIFSLITPGMSIAETNNGNVSHSLRDSKANVQAKVNSSLWDQLEKEDKVTFLIKFNEKTDTMKVSQEAREVAEKANLSAMKQEHAQRSAVISALKQTALESQQNVLAFLEEAEQKGLAEDIHAYHIVNGIAVTAGKEVAERLAAFPEVEKLLPNEQRELIKAVDTDAEVAQNNTADIEWNVERVGAPAVWDMGIDGQGAVVASIDTGVDWEHPALKDKYRGYDPVTGEVDHTYSFFDPVNGAEEPYDDDSHGTHVTGTMVGSEPDGSNKVGMAPGAQWISVQAFTPSGAYDTDLLAAAEWILAPGGDATKAPDVVNNSWGGGPGLDEWYRDAVTAWRAADIFPAFAAGNTTLTNPGGPGSVAVPANYPESFAAGSTNNSDNKSSFSLEGPSPYDEIKPDIAAPGEGIRSAVPGGGYGGKSGTSMASPAIAGVVALLKSANAGLDVDTAEEILMEMADAEAGTDSSFPESPNNGYGYGIVDAYAAVSSVISGLGTIEGQVTMDGEDTEPPTYEHKAPEETYSQMDLDVTIHASDNVSVTSVELHYGDQIIDASRTDGDFRSGEYTATIPGEDIEEGIFTYHWVINDFGNNQVITEEYHVNVLSGISIGYFEDFEGNSEPAGWEKTGTNNVWEWGKPASGPNEAFSGENVYATGLAGDYVSNMDATLVMPPIDMPEEGEAYLQFKSWHHFEQGSSGTNFDYGHLVISTDLEEWSVLREFYSEEEYWNSVEVDLRDYLGERVYIGYYTYSDGSVTRPGWYIDDVSLTDESQYADDDVPPTYEHESPLETSTGMPLFLSIDVYDDLLVGDAVLHYLDENGAWQDVETELAEDNATHGLFTVTVPGEVVAGDTFTYKWTVSDYAGNEVETEEYEIEVSEPITVGYFQDFEDTPAGWTTFGDNVAWERGIPTSGPEEAVSGENVYATDLAGDYPNNMDANLLMPAVQLPEGESYLQFKSWHNFEQSSLGTNWDYGYVRISTDLEEWTNLQIFEGEEEYWQDVEIELTDYAGQNVFIGFYAYSDGSITRPGWYIDDVALSDTMLGDEPTNMKPEIMEENVPSVTKEEMEKRQAESKNAVLKQTISGLNQPEVKEVQAEAQSELLSGGIPLDAQVSVLETGRATNTNPQDGTYTLMHAAGEFTILAEAYGFASEEQSVEVGADESVTADFTLEELPQGTVSGQITNERTGNPIEGATVLLAEDANVEPVETDENGNYELTGYEGTYTLKIVAGNYHSKDIELELEGNLTLDIELEPFYTVPGGEIYYDDGTAENARAFYDAGNKWAVKMSLPEERDSALVTDGVFQFHGTDWPIPGDTPFAVEVWSAGDDGLPDERLAGPIDAEAIRDLNEWTVVDLREESIQVDGDFFMVYVQTGANPNVPGLATDEDSPNAERSYQSVGGVWSQSPVNEGNYMIRARVAYEVETPEITSPADGLVTNEAGITVEGTASPDTTVEVLQNGEEAGSMEIGEDGSFAIDTELDEGENEFAAVTYVDGEDAADSDPVTITLDTEAPELTIDHPQDGERTNRETATVEGTVADENLDMVTVNGQETAVSDDGEFSQRILLDEGENIIDVVATDLAGNTARETLTIFAKYTAPEITNLTPDEDVELETGQSVMIEFESEPGLRTSFVVHMPLTDFGIQVLNATELPMMETTPGNYVGYYTVPRNAYADGAVIEVKAVDDFRNETRQQADGRLFINVE